MGQLNILHLSDLHFKPDDPDSQIVQKALFEDIKHLQSNKIQPQIVVFTGDVIYAGDFGYSEGRDDYPRVWDSFFLPLLDLLELDKDHLFICPGNHDVQRSQVEEYLECGLKQSLTSRDEVNKLIDTKEKHPAAFARMQNFDKFRDGLKNKFLQESNALYSTYVFECNGKSIGIACVNSAWRAYGGKDDYGNLLIGERVLDACVVQTAKCDIRIGVAHHPFEWLKEFERTNLKRLIQKSFNVWLSGHIHEQNIEIMPPPKGCGVISLTGGTLYASRDYWNGYSVIECPISPSNRIVAHLREYNDRGRTYGPSPIYEQGVWSHELSITSISPVDEKPSYLVRIRDSFTTEANKKLLPILGIGSSDRPSKDLRSLFVEPRIANESENRFSARGEINKKTEFLDLKDLVDSDKNLLFIGDKESGKTTLLHYIALAQLEPGTVNKSRLPVYLNFRQLPQGKINERVRKAIREYLHNLGQDDIDIEQDLLDGNCLLLIDDLDLNDKKQAAAMTRFFETYPSNRYILSSSQDILLDVGYQIQAKLCLEAQTCYLHSFGRKQVRGFINKWFYDGCPPGDTVLTDRVLDTIRETRLPLTPTIVSLVLVVIKQSDDIKVTLNKAALLESILEVLLEKSDLVGNGNINIDYRIKEDFLSCISIHMTDMPDHCLGIDDYRSYAEKYFADKGLPSCGSDRLLAYFQARGILSEIGERVHFRFNCFAEFFLARYMEENREYYNALISDDSYLRFPNEIDYLTGLQRKNRDILEFLKQKVNIFLDKFLAEYSLNPELDRFDSVSLSQSALDDLSESERESFLDGLKSTQFSEEAKDDLDEIITHRPIRDSEVANTKQVANSSNAYLLVNTLQIFSIATKNCELINDSAFKKACIADCLKSALKFLFITILRGDESVDNMSDENIEDIRATLLVQEKDVLPREYFSAHRVEIKDTLKIFNFLILERFLVSWLSGPYISTQLRDLIEDKQNPLSLRLLASMLYGSVQGIGFTHYYGQVLKEVFASRYYKEILLWELQSQYSFNHNNISPKDKQDIEAMIVDLMLDKYGRPKTEKGAILEKLRRDQRVNANNIAKDS